MRKFIKTYQFLKNVIKSLFIPIPNWHKFPRHKMFTILFEGSELIVPDNASFLSQEKEIFKDEIYNFHCNNMSPFIIDAGANIGVSIIYFKKKYPNSKIIAFEPDKFIFNVLKKNIYNFSFCDITLINKGLWDKDGIFDFRSEGSDSGRVINSNSDDINKSVELTSLKNYIDRKIDFLKIDIEGAETKVLIDIQKQLHFVEKIFIEYHSFKDQKQTLNEVINILTKAGFRLYISSPSLLSLSPFMKLNSYNDMDMQLNISGWK